MPSPISEAHTTVVPDAGAVSVSRSVSSGCHSASSPQRTSSVRKLLPQGALRSRIQMLRRRMPSAKSALSTRLPSVGMESEGAASPYAPLSESVSWQFVAHPSGNALMPPVKSTVV